MRAIGVERHLCLVDRGERELGEPEPDRRVRLDLLVTWIGDDTDEQPIEAEALDRLFGERDVAVVRRVEGTAEDPDTAHCQIIDLVADLDLRARPDTCVPERLLELLSFRRRADDPEALAGAQHAVPAPFGRPRAVLEECRQLLRGRLGRGSVLGAEREEQRFQLVDPGSRRARDAVHGHDPLVLRP